MIYLGKEDRYTPNIPLKGVVGMTKGRVKAPNGKHYDELSDDEVDEILAGPEPKK